MIEVCPYRMKIRTFNATRKCVSREGKGGALGTIKIPHLFTYMIQDTSSHFITISIHLHLQFTYCRLGFQGFLASCSCTPFLNFSHSLLLHSLGFTSGFSLQALFHIKTAYLYVMYYAIFFSLILEAGKACICYPLVGLF